MGGLRAVGRRLRDGYRQFGADNARQLAAALAYYTLFSVAPLVVVAVAIAGMAFGPDVARTELYEQMRDVLGEAGAKSIQALVEAAHQDRGAGIWATVLSAIMLLYGSLKVFLHLHESLDQIWEVSSEQRPPLWTRIKDRLFTFLFAFGTVLVIGALLAATLMVSTILGVIISLLGQVLPAEWLPGGRWLWWAVDFTTSLAVVTLLFAYVYRYLSDAEMRWRDVWFGAAVAASLFTVGKMLFGIYLAYTRTASAYGAAGSLVVFLIWVYYSAQILFYGAELVPAARGRSDPAQHLAPRVVTGG